MKPTLKAPGAKRLNLTSEELLSGIAFKINLRFYTEDGMRLCLRTMRSSEDVLFCGLHDIAPLWAGAYARPPFGSA